MKDPAILWYWNDWIGGTVTFSRFLKGCYIDLLAAQFNSGPLSLEEIKTVLGTDFAAWGSLSKKFKKTETGLFFNERMEVEKAKRKEFSDKQKERVLKRWNKSGIGSGNTTVLPKIENDNENDNEIRKEGKGGKTNKPQKQKQITVAVEIIYPFISCEFMEAWETWKLYKIQQFKFTYKSAITEQAALKDLSELSNNNEVRAIELIHYAISKGWKGIYEKSENNGKTIKPTAKSPTASRAEVVANIAAGFARGNEYLQGKSNS
jgi:hypothetical protein